eukprot:Lithocolla_globosa_v1_NODE_5475_length_1234_cov_3.466497.p3 type:complete len:114 gc:universal NODE_5475_length_1234_cov_3.466497:3-344(+)
MNLKLLQRGSNPEANTMLDWLEKGCFDALERKYLKKIVFGVYLNPDQPTLFEEVYEFKVSYAEEGAEGHVSMSRGDTPLMEAHMNGKKEIKKATQQLLRTLITMTHTLRMSEC